MDSPCDDNGQEVWTSQMIVAPAFVDAAAKDLATIGSAISRANAEALVPITALLPAGADDVSAAIAAQRCQRGRRNRAKRWRWRMAIRQRWQRRVRRDGPKWRQRRVGWAMG